MKSKIMSLLVVLTLILSGFMVMHTYNVGIIETAKGTKEVYDPSTVYYILSNNGTVNQSSNLTCGEWVTWAFPSNLFTKGDDYGVKVWNGTGLVELTVDNEEVNDYGNLYINFRVPGWHELDQNPIGTWNITLFKDNATDPFAGYSANITIGNLYDVWFEYDGSEVDHLVYGKAYSGFEIHVRNWTGTNWDDDFSSEQLDAVLYHQDGSTAEETVSGFDNVGTLPNFLVNKSDIGTDNKEVFWWVNITYDADDDGTQDPTYTSNVSIPVLLNMTFDIDSDITWGETIEINNGFLLDGSGSGMDSYGIRVYSPSDAGYIRAKAGTTAYDGTFSYDISTGPDYSYSAGTWFIGTYDSDASPRVNMTDDAPHIPGFIPYASFEVDPRDDVTVGLENEDDLTTGFNQTINISVKNESWMGDLTKEYQSMYVHVTGLRSYNFTTGKEYDEDDIVQVIDPTSYTPFVDSNEKYAYYEFSYHFNDTGTATIWVSHSGNITAIMNDTSGDTTHPGESGFYTMKYGNGNLNANMTGTKTVSVVGADSMNLVIDSMVDQVIVNEGPGALSSDRWINGSDTFILNIYGDSSSDRRNATIEVTGCGLDFTIEEDDPTDAEELVSWSAGMYEVEIAPKIAGTLTITATNDTNDESVSKDYTVTGLTGSVTTSEGDDLKLTVGSTETVTVEVNNGQYSEVTLTYFDTEWTKSDTATIVVNNTVGDGTEGEGLNGIFTFVPDEDDVDELGYIVVAAKAGGSNYMYDIIEIEPIYDLEIELVSPTLANATPTITVGLEQDLAFRLLDADGNDVEDDDPITTVKLIDEDHDEDNPLMSWSSEESGSWAIDQSGDEWKIDEMRPWWKGQLLIEGKNNTDGIAHAGNLTLDVDFATFTFAPEAATAGIGIENLTVTVTGVDANGDPLPDGTRIYFWCNDSVDPAAGGDAAFEDVVDFKDVDTNIELDEDGMGEFELDKVGDNKTKINVTIGAADPSEGNRSLGEFNIYFPTFALNPDTVYIGQSNLVEITATDHEGTPIEGINLTFVSSIPGILSAQPDPVQTDADGMVEISINPLASGKLNVTIARNLKYEDGQLNWTNSVVSDTYLTATSIQQMKISLSKSPIYEGETLTVTITSGTNVMADVDVEFGETTVKTDANGQATFTAPDPGVESAVYTVTAEKSGFITAEKSITVIKIWDITIIAPSSAPALGEEFTITVLAKGSPLAGATVTFNGKTYTSGADGKLTITAPDTAGDYTVTASYEDYTDATVTITIKEGGGIPGFELLTLIAALGVAFILIRRRR